MATSVTKDQIIAMAVKVIGILGGIAVGRGWLTGEQLTTLSDLIPQVITVAAIAGPLVYSIWANTRKKQISQVAAMPEVAKVVVSTPEVAAAQPSPKVVAQ